MALPADIVDRLAGSLGREDGERANERLLALQQRLGRGDHARVLRCVVHLAAGELARIDELVAAACLDWRDVIMWAEYARDGRRVHDFTKPFE